MNPVNNGPGKNVNDRYHTVIRHALPFPPKLCCSFSLIVPAPSQHVSALSSWSVIHVTKLLEKIYVVSQDMSEFQFKIQLGISMPYSFHTSPCTQCVNKFVGQVIGLSGNLYWNGFPNLFWFCPRGALLSSLDIAQRIQANT